MQPDLIEKFAAIVGGANAVTDQAVLAPRLVETRGLYHGASPLLLKPTSTEEVSAILALATESGTAIVPQSGNTGHVGGQTPREGREDVLLSLERMNRVREVDLAAGTMTVDAGCHSRQSAPAWRKSMVASFRCRSARRAVARSAATCRPMPAARRCWAYGNTRQLCLGLEVVLPTGEIWNGLRKLKKDNTGYDLRDLFNRCRGHAGRDHRRRGSSCCRNRAGIRWPLPG